MRQAGIGGRIFALVTRLMRWRSRTKPEPRTQREHQRTTMPHLPREVGHFNIAPGETLRADGHRDLVEEASMESFPCSDPPAIDPRSH